MGTQHHRLRRNRRHMGIRPHHALRRHACRPLRPPRPHAHRSLHRRTVLLRNRGHAGSLALLRRLHRRPHHRQPHARWSRTPHRSRELLQPAPQSRARHIRHGASLRRRNQHSDILAHCNCSQLAHRVPGARHNIPADSHPPVSRHAPQPRRHRPEHRRSARIAQKQRAPTQPRPGIISHARKSRRRARHPHAHRTQIRH